MKKAKFRRLRTLWSLTVASLKMYVRNTTGLFFSLFIPVILVTIFGLFSSSSGPSLKLNVNDQANNATSQALVNAIKHVDSFHVTTISEASAKTKLGQNSLDLEVVIPPEFGTHNAKGLVPAKITAEFNKSNPGNGQTAGLILSQIVSGFDSKATKISPVLSVETIGVKTNNLTYIDFLLPGIIGLSIMQLGIFSVAFAFISYKTTGALRRIQATPTHPLYFITAQAITRLLMGIAQVVLLLGLGVALFKFQLLGSLALFMFISILGELVFLAFGFAVAGYAKNENQAAPLSQLITFPMIFLSGTFFPRDAFPSWLRSITDYFPLTYLADALRKVSNDGATLFQVGGDVIGLIVWGIIMFAITVKVFRWE
jgi:ABC-2 type transport system permease protein